MSQHQNEVATRNQVKRQQNSIETNFLGRDRNSDNKRNNVAIRTKSEMLSDELKSHPFSVHFSDLFLSQKTDLCAEIWNN